MQTVPSQQEEIKAPDHLNKDEVEEFIKLLNTQLDRWGVKKLRFCFKQIHTHLRHIEKHRSEADRLIAIINGEPTPAQLMGYTTRKVRSAAYKFYSTVSDGMLDSYCDMFGVDPTHFDGREGVVMALTEAHVKRETNANS